MSTLHYVALALMVSWMVLLIAAMFHEHGVKGGILTLLVVICVILILGSV